VTRFAFTAAVAVVVACGCGSNPQGATKPTSVATTASTTPAAVTTTSVSPIQTTAGSGTVPTGDACALVSQQQASAAFGAPSSAPQPTASTLASGKACAYFANAEKDSLQVALLSNASPSEVAAIKSAIQLPGASSSTLSGIGDSATLTSTGPTAIVIFTKGSNVAVVTLNLIGQAAPVGAVTALARAAAEQI